MRLGLLGKHNISNALAAIAVGSHYGVGLDAMQCALESFHGIPMRMESLVVRGIRIINDAYNANPQSFARALEALRDISSAGKKILVMGDMLELGLMERQAHEEAGSKAAAAGVSRFMAVGRRAAWAAEAFVREKSQAQQAMLFDDAAGAVKPLHDMLQEGDVVLLKGSRGMRLERILAELRLESPAVSASGGR